MVFDEGAFCGAPPGDCLEGLVTCQTRESDYVVCEGGDPQSYTCPMGTVCDPEVTEGDPCRPIMESSTVDGG
jgi:hypothetical protein